MPPPIIMADDGVLLQYAVLDDTVGFISDHGLMFVDGKQIGRVPCLAICRDRTSPRFTLYYCDLDWNPVGVASHSSVDDAKRSAERIYPGSARCWTEAQFSDVDVNRYLREHLSDMRCSFCGKTPEQSITAMFDGEGDARVCGDCIRKFNAELDEPVN